MCLFVHIEFLTLPQPAVAMGGASVLLGPTHTELTLTQSEGLNSSPPAQLLIMFRLVPITLPSLVGLFLIQLIVQVVVMPYFGEHMKDWFVCLSRPTLLADVSGQMSQRAQRDAGLTVNSVSTSRKRQILALSGDIKSF